MMVRVFGAACAFVLTVLSFAAAGAQSESDIGASVYQQLSQKGEIVASSPWYGVLNEVAHKIAAVANPQYDYPFHFILVRENQANAFAVPGGNVYVTLPLMTFVRSKEELAGVLCHETSHDIHHDVLNVARKQQTTNLIAAGLQILVGGNSGLVNGVIGAVAQLQDLHYSRDVEEAADQKGALTCAEAGYNPWGMVWLFQAFSKENASGMEMLSDHPSDQHRISALEQLFANEPDVFGRFSRDPTSAHPMPTLAQATRAYGSVRGPAGTSTPR